MYHIPIYSVRLVRDGTQRVESKTVRLPKDCFDILRPYFAELDREHFVVVLLSTKQVVIGVNTVSVGTLNQTLVSMREVFKPAILANAAAVILAHNHPSGDPSPSPEDIQIAKMAVEAGRVLDIQVLDNLVAGDGRFVSLKERGLVG